MQLLMRKTFLGILGLLLIIGVNAQKTSLTKQPLIGVQFGLTDFQTANAIRTNSLGAVTGKDLWTKTKNMKLSIGATYLQGLSDYVDFSANLVFTSLRYAYRTETASPTDGFLYEGDASVHVKLLTDAYAVVPYLSAGVGASAYRGRFDAIMPIGAGLQIKLAPNNFVFSNFQYRVPVTARANYHFFYSVGIVSALHGSKAGR